MELHININLDNAAFEDAAGRFAPEQETARLLRELADTVDRRGLDVPAVLLDANGNTCGTVDTE